jgi:dihydrofolate reductase
MIVVKHFCPEKSIVMRKVILGLAVSLDGFIEGPNGEYDWCFTDQDYGMTEFFKRIDSTFMGRKTYELTLTMGDAAMPGFPKLKEYVFSTTLKDIKPGAILIKDNIEAEVKRIKNGPGKDIWLFGGAGLTASLLNLGLVDEINLAVHPIILGGGKPLFSNIKQRVALTLTDTKTYSSGLVALTYTLA